MITDMVNLKIIGLKSDGKDLSEHIRDLGVLHIEEEKITLLQAEKLEKRYKVMAEDLIAKINKSKLIESILHEISGDLWPNLGGTTKQKA